MQHVCPKPKPTYHAHSVQHAAQLCHEYEECSTLFAGSSSGESPRVLDYAFHTSATCLT